MDPFILNHKWVFYLYWLYTSEIGNEIKASRWYPLILTAVPIFELKGHFISSILYALSFVPFIVVEWIIVVMKWSILIASWEK